MEISIDSKQLTDWLTMLGTAYYQCEYCQGLHIVRVKDQNEIDDAKIELIDDILYYRITVEVKQSAIASLIADLSLINASSPILKVFLELQDEGNAKFVIMHTISCGEGLSLKQFILFMQQFEEQALQLVSELKQCDVLIDAALPNSTALSSSQTYH
ncbi:hypothetical protein RHO15_05465 [Utexia brackfieldae]|uniref:YbjN domain-containing protein n=1 Tax=Utexia brackfieldae TaxID=3074108 RepID=UPI00370D4C77